MQTVRVRSPQLHQVTKAVPVYITTRNMSLLPRFAVGEFAPLFRLLDDYATHQFSRNTYPAFVNTPVRSFQPRFDVRETKQGYELQGELPGLNQQDLAIEFTDAQTLSVSGRTERNIERGTRPAAVAQPTEPARIADTASEEASTNTSTSAFQKASVEDETAMSGSNSDAQYTPATSEASSSTETAPQDTQVSATKAEAVPEQAQSRYWVSERSVGSFHRTFAFPSRVDQENVKASLRNGILSIVVPKAQAPANRRINVE